MSDLVERLRKEQKKWESLGKTPIQGEAADCITKLEAEVTKLQAVVDRLEKYHHPDCNWWKWDWRFSWDKTDCNCDSVGSKHATKEDK